MTHKKENIPVSPEEWLKINARSNDIPNIEEGLNDSLWTNNVLSYMQEYADYYNQCYIRRLDSIKPIVDFITEENFDFSQDITKEKIDELIPLNKHQFIPIRDCSICGDPVGYGIAILESGDFSLGFDSNCSCIFEHRSKLLPRSSQELVDWYNRMQSIEERKRIIRAIQGKNV